MPTASGDIVIDFALLPDDPDYVDPRLSYLDAQHHKIASGLLNPVNVGATTFQYYNGAMGSGLIRSIIEVGANPGGSDALRAWIINTSGNGFGLHIDSGSVSLRKYVGGVLDDVPSSAAITAPASGQLPEIRWDPGTNTWSGYLDGSIIPGLAPVVDAFVSSGLRPGFGVDAQNSNLATIRSWGAYGLAPLSIATVAWWLA